MLTSTPVVRGFKMPDGLMSLGQSKSWAKIYDNGEARIYEWRGGAAHTVSTEDDDSIEIIGAPDPHLMEVA